MYQWHIPETHYLVRRIGVQNTVHTTKRSWNLLISDSTISLFGTVKPSPRSQSAAARKLFHLLVLLVESWWLTWLPSFLFDAFSISVGASHYLLAQELRLFSAVLLVHLRVVVRFSFELLWGWICYVSLLFLSI